jgi:hypothetical protein
VVADYIIPNANIVIPISMVWELAPSLDGEVDNTPVKPSYRNPLVSGVVAFELSHHVSKQILGEKRGPSVVLGLDQSMCCRSFVAFFVKGHRRIWQICGSHDNTNLAVVKEKRRRHDSNLQVTGGRWLVTAWKN